MVAFQLPSVKHLAVTSIACYTVYRILASLLNSRRRRALIRRNGCQPPFVYRPESKFWGLDTFLGLNVGNYQYVMKLVRESSLCPTRHREFESMLPAKTFEMKIMHVQWTYTNDVENVKHVMATDFANWVMAPGRYVLVLEECAKCFPRYKSRMFPRTFPSNDSADCNLESLALANFLVVASSLPTAPRGSIRAISSSPTSRVSM